MYPLEVKNLCHTYGDSEVFHDLNFHIEKGKILGLLGKNGMGKSTIINILNGFLKPTQGEALIFGKVVDELTGIEKAKIGVLNEGHLQYDFMTIKQVEKFYAGFYKGWNKSAFWELVERMGAAPNQRIKTLSRGQCSQVALGLIFAQNPEILILDDFSMGLDPGYRRLFVEYLREFIKVNNKTVFITSHIIQDMEELIDDVMVLDNKKVLVDSSLEEFQRNFKKYKFQLLPPITPIDFSDKCIVNVDYDTCFVSLYTYAELDEILAYLDKKKVSYKYLCQEQMTLEDAFIGLTGKY